jgi:hypothetical protein
LKEWRHPIPDGAALSKVDCIEESLYQFTRRETGNYRGITLLCQKFRLYEKILVNKITLEIKGKPAELHAFRKGRTTTDLIFGI